MLDSTAADVVLICASDGDAVVAAADSPVFNASFVVVDTSFSPDVVPPRKRLDILPQKPKDEVVILIGSSLPFDIFGFSVSVAEAVMVLEWP